MSVSVCPTVTLTRCASAAFDVPGKYVGAYPERSSDCAPIIMPLRKVAEIKYWPGGKPKMRNSPMSLVIDIRPLGIMRLRPPWFTDRIGATCASATGSPNSSRTWPVMIAPRGRLKSTFSTVCASRISSGLPGSNGRVWPYERPT